MQINFDLTTPNYQTAIKKNVPSPIHNTKDSFVIRFGGRDSAAEDRAIADLQIARENLEKARNTGTDEDFQQARETYKNANETLQDAIARNTTGGGRI